MPPTLDKLTNAQLIQLWSNANKYQGKWIVDVRSQKKETGVTVNIFTLNTGELLTRELTKDDILNSGDVGPAMV